MPCGVRFGCMMWRGLAVPGVKLLGFVQELLPAPAVFAIAQLLVCVPELQGVNANEESDTDKESHTTLDANGRKLFEATRPVEHCHREGEDSESGNGKREQFFNHATYSLDSGSTVIRACCKL